MLKNNLTISDVKVLKFKYANLRKYKCSFQAKAIQLFLIVSQSHPKTTSQHNLLLFFVQKIY